MAQSRCGVDSREPSEDTARVINARQGKYPLDIN